MSLNNLDTHSPGSMPAHITLPAGTKVPQDVPSLIAQGSAGTDAFVFATPDAALDVLSSELPRALLASVRADAADPFTRDAGLAVLADLYMDLMRVGRAAINLIHARAAGGEAAFDPGVSPFLFYLTDDRPTPPRAISDIIPGRHGDFARTRNWRDRLHVLRSFAQMSSRIGNRQVDAMARGSLIDQYLAAEGVQPANLNPYTLAWPHPGPTPAFVRDLADALTAVFDRLVLEPLVGDAPEAPRAREAARVFAVSWLSQAWHNHRFLASSPLRFVLGDVLVGAAPKMLGRSLAWLYRERGRQVWRFSHGGDRAFYDDDHWGLSEFPYCDRYMCYGSGEAEALALRYREDRTIRPQETPPVFMPVGMRRQQSIYEDMHAAPPAPADRKRIRVLYANSSFLGERAAHVPGVSLTDIHFADLQVWLLKQMRARGFEVVFKPHPKDVLSAAALFEGLTDEIEQRPFDPRNHDIDVYLFEYAGSAFFDALASTRGVVLIDPGLRPFDRTNEPYLRKRCEIVPAPADEMNRHRPDPDALVDAIERAAQVRACPEDFAQRFLYSDGAPR